MAHFCRARQAITGAAPATRGSTAHNCDRNITREVFRPAIAHSAASVVLAHNHPSGDPEPSEEDLTITKRLVEVRELAVLDHVIVADRGVVSFGAPQLI